MKKIILLFILMFAFPLIINAEEQELLNAKLIKCENANYSYFEINEKKEFIKLLSFDRTSGYLDNEIDEYTCNLLENANEIKIEYDKLATKDTYNRKFAYVYLDNKLLQKTLIEKGYGQVSNIKNNYNYLNELCDSEKIAIQNKLGIWNYENVKEEYCKSGIDLNNTNTSEKNTNEKKENKSISYLYTLILISSAILLLLLLKKVQD